MTRYVLISFLNGAIMMACLVASLVFFKFRIATQDRFFSLFSLAFLLLSIDRIAILVAGGVNEVFPPVYIIRCLGFLLIIGAVVDKNRTSAS